MTNLRTTELLGLADVREQFKLGRDLATKIMCLLPHVTLGKKGNGDQRLVRRADFDKLIWRAASEQRDLWELARDFTPEEMRDWLAADSQRFN